MRGKGRFRLSYANVVASVALFVALGGSSYAAIKLPAGSVGAKQLRTAAVTSAKVKDGSLARRDFRAGELAGAPGPAGPAGLTGPAGKDGQPGAPGRSALEPLRSGETIHGVVGADEHVDTANSGTTFGVVETFPVPAPQPLQGGDVSVDGASDVGNRCTGTLEAPTAPPGVVCIYNGSSQNAEDLEGLATPTGAGSRFGFEIRWGAPDLGDTSIRATWAYQAP